MPSLYDKQSGAMIGRIEEQDLDFLIRQLEEEDLDDQDYYIDPATIDWFEDQRGDPALIEMLRAALGDRDGMEIAWQED